MGRPARKKKRSRKIITTIVPAHNNDSADDTHSTIDVIYSIYGAGSEALRRRQRERTSQQQENSKAAGGDNIHNSREYRVERQHTHQENSKAASGGGNNSSRTSRSSSSGIFLHDCMTTSPRQENAKAGGDNINHSRQYRVVSEHELPADCSQWLERCAATAADLVGWLADMPRCNCASSDILSWPEAESAVFSGTPFGARVVATRAAMAGLHAAAVQPLIDAGRLFPPTDFTLERLIWARGKQLRHSPPPAALSTSVRLWSGLPLVKDNQLDTYEMFVSAVFPLTSEADASVLHIRLTHLRNAEGIATVQCEQTSVGDGRSGARVRAGPFVLRRREAVSYSSRS